MPWRYALFGGLCLIAAPLSLLMPWQEAFLIGFDAGALAYFLTLPRLFGQDAAGIRKEAARADPEAKMLLLLTAIVLLVIMVSIATVLVEKQDGDNLAVLLCLATLAVAWCFSNMVYTLHYAHLYYSDRDGGDRKGLQFPQEDKPDYWDFAYFAFTIGMTFQTSDVTISGSHIRRIVTLQSLAAFIFNLGILAFSINILANL